MILTHSLKVCLATRPCDLRKSFDTLSVVVSEELREDPLSRKLFVFLNRNCDRVKLLYWDGTGLWVLAKRLEPVLSPAQPGGRGHQADAQARSP